MEKVRQEYKEKILKPALEEDPSLANSPTRDVLTKLVTMEAAQDLEYTAMLLQEALRFRTATAASAFYIPRHDLNLGKSHFKKGDMLQISFEAIHHDPA